MRSKLLVATIIASIAVHAAIAFTAPDPASSSAAIELRSVASRSAMLRLALTPPARRIEAERPKAIDASAVPATLQGGEMKSNRKVARRNASSVVSTDRALTPQDARVEAAAKWTASTEEASDTATRPTPLSYPILELPPGDDPHRIGLVRLLLVVSSEGKVAQVLVTAATMSQDYIDRVTRSFEQMRFSPGLLRGAPHPGWYEVVVNFDYEPEGAKLL